MKILTCAITAGLTAITLPAHADVFTLKDGTKLDGSILRQDATSYVLEVHITKSIKDERIVAKSDVVKIDKDQPDLTAFVEIAKLVPVPDMLTADEYAVRIRKVEKFLADNKKSSKSKDAGEILTSLKEEANQVHAGAIKMGGKFISPEEYRSNVYEIDSRVQEAKVRAHLRDPQRIKALRAYMEFNKDYPNTNANAALLPLIIQAINAYLVEVEQLESTFDARTNKRMQGLEQMSAADHNASETAIREEGTEQARIFKQEKDGGVGWVTLQPYCKLTLDETLSFGKQELARLVTQRSAPAVDAGKIYRETLALIQGKGNTAAVTAALTNVKNAKIAPRYIAILEDAAKNSGIKH